YCRVDPIWLVYAGWLCTICRFVFERHISGNNHVISAAARKRPSHEYVYAGDTMTAPIFLLASERSGTNLLRRRLTEAQSNVYGAAPLHLLKHLYFAEPYYGDLSDDANFRRF